MPPLVTSLLMSMGLIVAAPAVLAALTLCFEAIKLREDDALLAAGVITVSLFAICWTLLWRHHVRWTRTRAVLTVGAFLLAWIAAISAFAIVSVRGGGGPLLLAYMILIATWAIASTLAWRETKAERAARLSGRGDRLLPCPKCGYNLTGLREARCPECGATYTLDELVGTFVEQRAPLSSD